MMSPKFSASNIFKISSLLVTFATLRADASSSVTINGSPCLVDSIVTRDVCVIGGGSTGTYSAIRLSDLGKTVVVVEEKDRLGGHTETYHDPKTGSTVDYGVVVLHNLDIVKNYFARLNVSLAKGSTADLGVTEYFDFQTGRPFSDYSPTDPSAALAEYATQLAKYPYVEEGFDLPYPVPSDLLLPFGKFVKKYQLESMMGLIFTFAQGLGDLLAQPTLYVFKNFGSDLLKDLQIGFLSTPSQDNSLLYEQAAKVLGAQNVFLNSKILAVDRSSRDEAKVLVQTPSGLTVIKSSKLIFTIPPKLDNLQGWDLDSRERSLFGQFTNSGYYTAILRDSGLPENLTVVNVSPNTLYNLAVLPAIYKLGPSGVPGLTNLKFGSAQALSDGEVRKEILDSVNRLKIPRTGRSNPELVVYSSHTPFELTVSPREIAGGFYKRLYGLQSHRHTYYTGAAFHTHDSSLLWQFTEKLLPNITAS